MYESACKLMAKQKVALECLSYHATANQSQTEDLIKDHIPSAEAYTLYSFTFNGQSMFRFNAILGIYYSNVAK